MKKRLSLLAIGIALVMLLVWLSSKKYFTTFTTDVVVHCDITISGKFIEDYDTITQGADVIGKYEFIIDPYIDRDSTDGIARFHQQSY